MNKIKNKQFEESTNDDSWYPYVYKYDIDLPQGYNWHCQWGPMVATHTHIELGGHTLAS